MDHREIQAALAWSALPYVGERSFQALLERARESRQTLAELWHAPLEELKHIVGLHPRSLAALEADGEARWKRAGADADAVHGRGVDLFLLGDPEYPVSLAAATPARRWPMLFGYGALGLLEEPRVALVSSRSVTNTGLAATDALADALARRDVCLVTSTNRESYQAAAVAAKRHAGPSIMVLDRGIAEAFPGGMTREPVAPARVWDAALDPDLQLLLSPFGWAEPWNPRSGRLRDTLIADLADVIVAVDLSTDGNMASLCRSMAGRKRVLALDRGGETPEGTRALWEEAPEVRRLRWEGGETTVEGVLAGLPGGAPAGASVRPTDGRQRELAQFLARASMLLETADPADRRTRAVGAFPTAGVIADVASRWSHGTADGSAGVEWLLADLIHTGNHSPSRVGQLLQRVARGGLLAAIVPAEWLEPGTAAAARREWLEDARLRLAVRLPQLPFAGGAESPPPAAAVFLQRDHGTAGPPLTFSPAQDPMGRFHLRRYLHEVLSQLPAPDRETRAPAENIP